MELTIIIWQQLTQYDWQQAHSHNKTIRGFHFGLSPSQLSLLPPSHFVSCFPLSLSSLPLKRGVWGPSREKFSSSIQLQVKLKAFSEQKMWFLIKDFIM
jgi:hypothetical protein